MLVLLQCSFAQEKPQAAGFTLNGIMEFSLEISHEISHGFVPKKKKNEKKKKRAVCGAGDVRGKVAMGIDLIRVEKRVDVMMCNHPGVIYPSWERSHTLR